MKRPSISQSLALRAAAAAKNNEDQVDDGAAPSEDLARRSYDDPTDDEILSDRGDAPAPDETPPSSQSDNAPAPISPKGRGRPAGKRDYAARQTVYLDEARHQALKRMSKGTGRSVHSLLIEGIDRVIGKPEVKGWE